MTASRRSLISLDSTPYYHCIARCVRRAFLCGEDQYSGRNFNHRKQWLVDHLALQASVFAIDICAYAIMSNHYHVVLAVDRRRLATWSDDEVIERWTRLFKGPLLIQQYRAGERLTATQMTTIHDIADVWRERLASISWFMRCLNERVARQANAEDNCRGRFWEGRFKSIALLDEAALLSCMAYVDLNPVRAGITDSLLASDFTSIQARLRGATVHKVGHCTSHHLPALRAFRENEHVSRPANLLPWSLQGYLELVDWTGRQLRSDKTSGINHSLTPTLSLLGLSPAQWLALSLDHQSRAACAIGSLSRMCLFGQALGKRWLRGQRTIADSYRTG